LRTWRVTDQLPLYCVHFRMALSFCASTFKYPHGEGHILPLPYSTSSLISIALGNASSFLLVSICLVVFIVFLFLLFDFSKAKPPNLLGGGVNLDLDTYYFVGS
jgi:hypothetical protein